MFDGVHLYSRLNKITVTIVLRQTKRFCWPLAYVFMKLCWLSNANLRYSAYDLSPLSPFVHCLGNV